MWNEITCWIRKAFETPLYWIAGREGGFWMEGNEASLFWGVNGYMNGYYTRLFQPSMLHGWENYWSHVISLHLQYQSEPNQPNQFTLEIERLFIHWFSILKIIACKVKLYNQPFYMKYLFLVMIFGLADLHIDIRYHLRNILQRKFR